jgi:septal ring factor EnvC (AmiA/AmiB activator)
MAPPRRAAAGSDNSDLWKWIAAIVAALLVGLTPFLLSISSQRDYAQKEDLAVIAAQLTALSERVARNEEQTAQATDAVAKLLEIAQNGETRLSDIEAALARIEASIQVATGGSP